MDRTGLDPGRDGGRGAAALPGEGLRDEWVGFPGGELEGRRPRALCVRCRERLQRAAGGADSEEARSGTLCFQCYRADFERHRAILRAGQLDTASTERFQGVLPFEPVDRRRLERLKAERSAGREESGSGSDRFAARRRRAQMAARHALERTVADATARLGADDARRAVAAAVHAAELQLPESWIPFVAPRR